MVCFGVSVVETLGFTIRESVGNTVIVHHMSCFFRVKCNVLLTNRFKTVATSGLELK
jgi:hypothetical protein